MPAKRKTPVAVEAPPVSAALSLEAPFTCTGIREDNPRDFLAALGFLRLLKMVFPSHRVLLSWLPGGSASFSASLPLPESFLETTVSYLKKLNNAQPHPFVHNKVIKVPLPAYRSAVQKSLELSHESEFPAALYSAYASQIHDPEKGGAVPTSFSFSNGQGGKELLRDISELLAKVWSPAQLHADLKGDPLARKDAKSFRWHPAEYRAAAYRAADPGGNVKGDVVPDHPSLNILAFFGLSFYPVVDRASRAFTCGFSRRKSDHAHSDAFTWPVWETPLDADTVSSLLLHPALHSETRDPLALRALGCRRAWYSRRFSADKSLYFSPAIQIF